MAQNSVSGNGIGQGRGATSDGFSPDRALDALSDRWGLLIMDRVLHDVTLVDDLSRQLAIPSDQVVSRLDELVSAGLMAASRSGGRRERAYRLTEQGRNLECVVAALLAWPDGWLAADARGESGAPTAALTLAAEPVAAEVSTSTGPSSGPGADRTADRVELRLLGAFAVQVGDRLSTPIATGSQRLLAFLALHDRAVARGSMAGRMWPDASEENAAISLRSALSRLDPATRDSIESGTTGLSLSTSVSVDLRNARALALRLLRPGNEHLPEDLDGDATAALSAELLPDWYDEWVVSEAEDWRQLRIAALEAQSTKLLASGRLAESATAARFAIKADSLRESSVACLIRVHLAEGNQSEAIRCYEGYRDLLDEALAIDPTELLSSLVRGIRRVRSRMAPPAPIALRRVATN